MAKCQNPNCKNEEVNNSLYCSDNCFLEDQKDWDEGNVEHKIPVPVYPENHGYVKLNEVTVQRINLEPGDTLMVTVKNDDISAFALDMLQKKFKEVYPNNKVFIFGMGTDGDVKLAVVSEPKKGYSCDEINYCSDCDCGKKERAEAKQKGNPDDGSKID